MGICEKEHPLNFVLIFNFPRMFVAITDNSLACNLIYQIGTFFLIGNELHLKYISMELFIVLSNLI
jgi:hypothetical protein